MPDRHHLQNSYLKECWSICAYCIRYVCSLQGCATACFLQQTLNVILHLNNAAQSKLRVASSDVFPLTYSTERLQPISPLLVSLHSFSCLGHQYTRHAPPPSFLPPPWACSSLKKLQSSSKHLLPSVSTLLVWLLASIKFASGQNRHSFLHSKPLLPSIKCPSCLFFVTSSPKVLPCVVAIAQMAV